MATTADSTPITVAPSDWSGSAGERWAANVDQQEAMLAMVGAGLLAHAGFAPGERVVEIGCGGGALTRKIAAAVSPGGEIVGFDISPVLVELAAGRAAAAGLTNCRFLTGDAQTDSPPGAPFDRLTSRFGVMFFPDPARAMTNLHAMLKPGGRLDVAVWAPVEENPMFTILMGAARAHIAIAPATPRAPGPLAFSESEYFAGLLAGAGFANIRFDKWRGLLRPGGDATTLGRTAERMMTANSLAEIVANERAEVRAAILADIESSLTEYATSEGVAIPASVHLVSATA